MIRLRYTGLLIFSSEVLSFFTGFIFLSFIARNLSTCDYGVWRFILSTLVYFDFIRNILPFWAFRDSSRGKPIEKTVVIGNLILSIPFTLMFLILVPTFADVINSSQLFFYFSCVIIPGNYIMQSLDLLIRAKFPHKLAYKNIILDLLKIVSIFGLIQYGLTGVIISYCIGLYGYVLCGLYILRNYLKNDFKRTKIIQWISNSWVLIYGQLGQKIYLGFDVFLLGLYGSTNLGAYSVAESIASLIIAARGLIFALYPKMMSGDSQNKLSIKQIMMLLLMFIIPMTVGCFLLAPNMIEFFGTKYLEGLLPLQVLLIGAFFHTISRVDRSILLATENVDEQRQISFIDLIKSNIFFLESLAYVGIFVGFLFMYFLIPEYDIVGCTIAIFFSTISMSLLMMLRSKFIALRTISVKRLFKYLFSSIIMSIFILLFYSRGTINTLIIIIISVIIYFGVLLIIDEETRDLAKKILIEFKMIWKTRNRLE